MRLPPVLILILALLVIPATAVASRDHWTGAGVGQGSRSGGQCSIAIEAEVDRVGDSSVWDIGIIALTTSAELCFLAFIHDFRGVDGSPQDGWRKVFVEPCGTRTITIGPLGVLPAGLTTISFQNAGCAGGWGNGRIAFAAEDPA